jgi:hypothetical protein
MGFNIKVSSFYILTPNNQYILFDKVSNLFHILQIQLSQIMILRIISCLIIMFSRGKMVGTVQDLVISELYGKKFVFALHLDGTLRIWDLVSHSRVFSHNMGVMLMAGTVYLLDLILSILYIYVILTLLLSGPLPTIKTTLSIDFCSNHVYMNGRYWETCK